MRATLSFWVFGAASAVLLAAASTVGSVNVDAQSTTAPPETFIAQAQTSDKNAGMSASITIYIEKYVAERDRTMLQDALRIGGYPGFLPALRKAPELGYLDLNGKKTPIRWARQQPSEKGRTISVVTDSPVFFVGGGAVDAKPRTGFDVAVAQIEIDSAGIGTGTLAAAARVRPGGATGVQIDDYAETPVKLTSVRKSFR